jgi:hypothetical protein
MQGASHPSGHKSPAGGQRQGARERVSKPAGSAGTVWGRSESSPVDNRPGVNAISTPSVGGIDLNSGVKPSVLRVSTQHYLLKDSGPS